MLDVVKALQQQKKWEASVPLLVELLSRLSLEQSINVRLKLAQILIQITEQPRQALAVLTKIPKELPEKQRKLRQQLAQCQARDRRRKPGSGNPRLVTSRDFSEPQRPILFALSAHSYVRRTSLSVETNSPTDKDVRRTLPATKSTKSFTGKIMT